MKVEILGTKIEFVLYPTVNKYFFVTKEETPSFLNLMRKSDG